MALERTNPPEPVTSVFLLAENRLLREALLRLLTKKEDIRIVGSAAYSPKILQEILLAAPEVVVLDSVSKSLWQDGVMRRLQDSKPQVKVLMIGMEADEALFLRMVAEGV